MVGDWLDIDIIDILWWLEVAVVVVVVVVGNGMTFGERPRGVNVGLMGLMINVRGLDRFGATSLDVEASYLYAKPLEQQPST